MTSNNSNSNSIFLEPSHVRLVTITAHVDHGKTTLADHLIASNGIISERLAGTLRYLDSDPEEQRRGITMRTSAIGLSHTHVSHNKKNQIENTSNNKQKVLIHLLDSPGHGDFSSEVSSALLASDSALLVMDAVEGMGARTHQVMRETYAQELVPILVVNKIDRLCTELSLTPVEAYVRLRGLLETINAAAAAMLWSARQEQNNGEDASDDQQPVIQKSEAALEQEERYWTFDPAVGNVVFASALHGWGFTAPALARSLFRQGVVTIRPPILKQYLFGDHKLRGTDKIVKVKLTSGNSSSSEEDMPLFARFGLLPLWNIYEGVAAAASVCGLGSSLADGKKASSSKLRADTPGMQQVWESLQRGATSAKALEQTHNVTTSWSDVEKEAIWTRTGANSEESVVRALLQLYRPLSECVLDVVTEYGPSPALAASQVRTHALALRTPPSHTTNTATSPPSPEWERIQQAVRTCDASIDSPVVAHVCKFMSTDRILVRDPLVASLGDTSSSNLLLGVTRVLSGRLTTGGEYYLLGRDYSFLDFEHSSRLPPPKQIVRLYLLMGSSFVLVDEVPAGHLCAIYYNIEAYPMKAVTLCDSVYGMPLKGFQQQVRPLVKVNIETENANDMDDFERGLVRLNLVDGAVEVTTTAKGERILACLGELHLEQCLLDLEKVYCGREIKLRSSDPIIDFRETTEWFEHETDFAGFFNESTFVPPLRQATIPPYNEEEGLAHATRGRMRSIVSGRSAAIHLRVLPLVQPVYQALQSKKVVPDSAEELLKLGDALNFPSNTSAEDILCGINGHILVVGANGNALLESPGVRQGRCVVGVPSNNHQVYVPPSAMTMPKLSNQPMESSNDENTAKADVDHSGAAKNAYDRLQLCLQEGWRIEQSERSDYGCDVDLVAHALWGDLKGSCLAGFTFSVRAGPICEEPLRNLLVIVEGVEIVVSQSNQNGGCQSSDEVTGGKVVAAMRPGIRCALLTRPARLMEGMLRLTVHSSLAALGGLYKVLSQRRGKVVEDAMVDGTDLIKITAFVPQAESFGLAPQMFRETSGEVTFPSLVFSHWQQLEVDPFWIPTTEEEREDYGELLQAGDRSTGMDNTALMYIRKVRQRKGLRIDAGRTVTAAEKQRTLKR